MVRCSSPAPVDELLAEHKLLTGPRRDVRSLPSDQFVVRASHTDRQTTVLVRTTRPILDPTWVVSDIGLEDLVLAYMAGTAPTPARSARCGAVMTWLAWRQARGQALVAVAATAMVAVVLVATRGHIAATPEEDLSTFY